MYERRASPLASRRVFARRIALSFASGVGIIALSLGAGILQHDVATRHGDRHRGERLATCRGL